MTYIINLEQGPVSCRICLEVEPASSLFQPCLCDGTMGLVHRECLQQWRRTTQNPIAVLKCLNCNYEYSLRSTCFQSVCDPYLSLSKFWIFCMFRKSLDLSMILMLPKSIAMFAERNEEYYMYPIPPNQQNAFLIQLLSMIVCCFIMMCLQLHQATNTMHSLQQTCITYKKVTHTYIFISIITFFIVPVVSICMFSSVIDFWLWMYMIHRNEYMKRFRSIMEYSG